MCTLAVYHSVSGRWPLIVAANRDEFYARATAAPTSLQAPFGVLAGRDLEAGGTWLGLAKQERPFVVAVLNRREPDGPAAATVAGQRSRGLLCSDLLEAEDFDAALTRLDAMDVRAYAGFNLLLAEPGRALVLDNRNDNRADNRAIAWRTTLDPGLAVLTNLNLNDPRCPRLAGAVGTFESALPLVQSDPSADVLAATLGGLLGNHQVTDSNVDSGPFARLCVHVDGYGTRSASMIAVADDGEGAYFHGDGPPCRTPLVRVL